MLWGKSPTQEFIDFAIKVNQGRHWGAGGRRPPQGKREKKQRKKKEKKEKKEKKKERKKRTI